MTNRIIHYYWALSDWAYFGFPRLDALATEFDAVIDHRPVDLPSVYKRTGGVLLAERGRQRQEYRFFELERWRQRLGMPLNLHPKHFPENVHLASQLIYAVKADGTDPGPLSFAILRAMWVDDRNIDDKQTLVSIADESGLDGHRFIEIAQSDAIIDTYRRNTDQAVQDGVFGSPFYIVNGEKFWGQDRLFMVKEVLAR